MSTFSSPIYGIRRLQNSSSILFFKLICSFHLLLLGLILVSSNLLRLIITIFTETCYMHIARTYYWEQTCIWLWHNLSLEWRWKALDINMHASCHARERSNNFIATWLLNSSIRDQCKCNYIYSSTVTNIWNVLQEIFQQQYGPRIFSNWRKRNCRLLILRFNIDNKLLLDNIQPPFFITK